MKFLEGKHVECEQDEIYSKLIKAMRIDLYGKRKVKDHPNKIGLTRIV